MNQSSTYYTPQLPRTDEPDAVHHRRRKKERKKHKDKKYGSYKGKSTGIIYIIFPVKKHSSFND